jgi:hypothetical protein
VGFRRRVEGDDAVVNVFFELVVCHSSFFVHPDCARPAPLLCATKSAACVQSVGQKLKLDLLPLLGHHACRQLEVRRYTLTCSAAALALPSLWQQEWLHTKGPGRERPCTSSRSACQFALGVTFSSPSSPEKGGYQH